MEAAYPIPTLRRTSLAPDAPNARGRSVLRFVMSGLALGASFFATLNAGPGTDSLDASTPPTPVVVVVVVVDS